MKTAPRTLLFLLCGAVVFSATASAQPAPRHATAQPATPPSPYPPAPVIQVRTQLVLLDLVVEDKNGLPVHGLKATDFQITEDNAPQSVRSFEEHSFQAALPAAQAPKLQPGYFIDYSPVASSGALTVLLLDSLNTPIEDQAWVMSQLREYLSHAGREPRIAIFGLSNRLLLLQGFTSDPQILSEALRRKASPVKSPLIGSPSGYSPDTNAMSNIMNTSQDSAEMIQRTTETLQQFEAESHALQTKLRVQRTLDALNVLGHYLAGLPGRKNVVWFSGAFPTEVIPDPALSDPFGVSQVDREQFRRTINLFARSQIAVYPVDAHGLDTQPSYDVTSAAISQTRPTIAALNSRSGVNNDPTRIESQDVQSARERSDARATMEAIATDTGGRAYYNSNDLSGAIAKTIDAGSNFYALAYSPSHHEQDGRYRTIRVKLSPSAAGSGLKLAYRRGYFADSPKSAESAAVSLAKLDPQQAANDLTATVMAHGAPAPGEVLFEARIVPASPGPESTALSGNRLNPKLAVNGPFRRYSVDYVALPNQFTLVEAGAGRHTGALEFLAYVYDDAGRLLLLDGRTVTLDLSADQYAQFLRRPFTLHLEVSAPIRNARSLRVAVRDVPSDRYGVIEAQLAPRGDGSAAVQHP